MTVKFLLLALFASETALASPPKLLPLPAHMTEQRGNFVLSGSETIGVPPGDKGAAEAAAFLSQLLRSSNGDQLKVRPRAARLRGRCRQRRE